MSEEPVVGVLASERQLVSVRQVEVINRDADTSNALAGKVPTYRLSESRLSGALRRREANDQRTPAWARRSCLEDPIGQIAPVVVACQLTDVPNYPNGGSDRPAPLRYFFQP